MANLYFQHHSSSFQHLMIRQKSMLKCWKLFLFFFCFSIFWWMESSSEQHLFEI